MKQANKQKFSYHYSPPSSLVYIFRVQKSNTYQVSILLIVTKFCQKVVCEIKRPLYIVEYNTDSIGLEHMLSSVKPIHV
jgi:hypothetical protein